MPAQILELLKRLQEKTGMTVIFITHNLGVVAEIADRAMVMYSGRIVEQADVVSLFKQPRMPYTQGLLRSVPPLSAGKRLGRQLDAIPGNFSPTRCICRGLLVSAALPSRSRGALRCRVAGAGGSRPGPAGALRALARYRPRGRLIHERSPACRCAAPMVRTAAPPVRWSAGERKGRGRSLVRHTDRRGTWPGGRVGLRQDDGRAHDPRLNVPTDGSIVFRDQDITHLTPRQMRPIRREMQLIFQDPFASLNPRMTVERIVAAPLVIHERTASATARKKRVAAMLRTVGLSPRRASRYLHEFSGGQRQRHSACTDHAAAVPGRR